MASSKWSRELIKARRSTGLSKKVRQLQGGNARFGMQQRFRPLGIPHRRVVVGGRARRTLPTFDRLFPPPGSSSYRHLTTQRRRSGVQETFYNLVGPRFHCENLSEEDCCVLSEIFFGQFTESTFGPNWVNQRFNFRPTNSAAPFGLVQHTNEPSGAVAAVQAVMLNTLLWGDGVRCSDKRKKLAATKSQRRAALISAIVEMFERAASGTRGQYQYVLGQVEPFAPGASAFASLVVYDIEPEHFKPFLIGNYTQFEDGGVVNLLVSLALTRGLPNVQEDLQYEGALLTTSKGGLDASQESINLILTGAAVGGTFSAQDHPADVEGIAGQSTYGYLTPRGTSEHEVGSHLLNPKLPVWVAHHDGKYSVLFSPTIEPFTSRLGWFFHLCHYDASVDALEPFSVYEVDLHIKSDGRFDTNNIFECIRLRWPDATIRATFGVTVEHYIL